MTENNIKIPSNTNVTEEPRLQEYVVLQVEDSSLAAGKILSDQKSQETSAGLFVP